jgi:hypothetical protein
MNRVLSTPSIGADNRRRPLEPGLRSHRHSPAWADLAGRQKNDRNVWREVKNATGTATHYHDPIWQYFRSPDSGQENQPDCDTRALRSLGGFVDAGEEGGELFVIEGALARPFGASRANEQLHRRGLDNLPVDNVPEHPRSFRSPSFANLEGHVAADGRGVCAVKRYHGSTDRDIACRNVEKGRPSISEVFYIQDQVEVAP